MRPAQNLARAIGWTVVSVLAFTLTAWAGREAGKHLSPMHMVFYRNVISLIILIAVFRWLGITLESLKTRRPWLNWGRALLHFCGQWCWMMALVMIPLIELIALEFTFPIWVALLAPLLLGERVTPARIFAALMGFAGVLTIVLGPVALSGGTAGPSFNLGSFMALACAVFFCFNIIGTRFLTRYDGPMTILLFMTVNHSVLAFLLGLPTMRMPPGYIIPWVLVLGLASLVAHFATARALAYADSSIVAPLDFLRIPLIVALGALAYQETLQPIALAGALLVIGGNGVNIWAEHKRRSSA